MKKIVETYKQYNLSCLPTQANKSPKQGCKWKDIDIPIDEFTEEGIGIKCGKASGGLECFDFDNHFGDAKKTLVNFVEANTLYEKYEFPIQSTKSDGYHLLFRCLKNEGNLKLAQRLKNGAPDAIIETRGEGGYFVVAPSPGYKIIRGDISKVPMITESERELLIETARSLNEYEKINYQSDETKERPGDIFNRSREAREQMKTALTQAGWAEISKGTWRRPGKDEGISATMDKVAENIFYNFSANGHPFEPNRAYTPFQVVALCQYGGDFSAFAKELSREKPSRVVIENAKIDLEQEIKKPPIVLSIMTFDLEKSYNRILTKGNFSVLTGKSKAKKTFFSTFILATCVQGGETFGKFYAPKQKVILFDTEQSMYDAWVTARRIKKYTNDYSNLTAYNLREYEPIERCGFIEKCLYEKTPDVAIIDGIADLSKANNNEEEAVRVVSLLMKWTKQVNCHIVTIIHQNKADNYATGHIGSYCMKKAEVVISITKCKENKQISTVSCDMIRGTSDFEDFDFQIVEGLPEVVPAHQITPF